MQRQFEQIDSQITSVSTVAGRYEEAQRTAQTQAKQIADLNNSIKYLEGLLDSAQAQLKDTSKVDGLQQQVTSLRAEVASRESEAVAAKAREEALASTVRDL